MGGEWTFKLKGWQMISLKFGWEIVTWPLINLV